VAMWCLQSMVCTSCFRPNSGKSSHPRSKPHATVVPIKML
jgi:hypothetical protein